MDTASRLRALDINADEVLATLSLRTEPFTIFVTGSIVEGYGNVDSDLDVVVVYKGDFYSLAEDYDMGQMVISIDYRESGQRLDVESWSQEKIFSVAYRLGQLSNAQTADYFTMDRIDLLTAHRVKIGIPLLHPENFEDLFSKFDFSAISTIIMKRNLAVFDATQEDAAGAIASRQHGTALLMSRKCLHLAIDAFTAFNGETNLKEKWRFFKLEKIGDVEILNKYWELETPRIDDRDDIFEYAEQCLLFASQLSTKIQRARPE